MGNIISDIFNNTIGKLGGLIGGLFGGILKKFGWGQAVNIAVDKGSEEIDKFFDFIEDIRDEKLKKIPAEELALILKYMRAVKDSLASGEEKFDLVVSGYISKWPQVSKDIAEPLVQCVYDNVKDFFNL